MNISDAVIRGITWRGRVPSIEVCIGIGEVEYIPVMGSTLAYEPVNDARYCLGYSKFSPDGTGSSISCPTRSIASSGGRCRACSDLDDSRYLHAIHRGSWAPDGVRAYLSQPHWLYVATFADGSSKVGTASEVRKYERVAEQGAAIATFVAKAMDGVGIRQIEDFVSREAAIAQGVRLAAKSEAWISPLTKGDVTQANSDQVARIRSVLTDAIASFGGYETEERWDSPADALYRVSSRPRVLYPADIGSERTNLTVLDICGETALCLNRGSKEPESVEYIVNLRDLRGRRVRSGDFPVSLAPVQTTLF